MNNRHAYVFRTVDSNLATDDQTTFIAVLTPGREKFEKILSHWGVYGLGGLQTRAHLRSIIDDFQTRSLVAESGTLHYEVLCGQCQEFQPFANPILVKGADNGETRFECPACEHTIEI